jgi:hypothetical protein
MSDIWNEVINVLKISIENIQSYRKGRADLPKTCQDALLKLDNNNCDIIIWKGDKNYHNLLNNLKSASIELSSMSTKLTLVCSHNPSNSALQSIIVELTQILNMFIHCYFTLIECKLSRPLFNIITDTVIGVLQHYNDLINKLSIGEFSQANITTGMIWKACENVSKIPISNKIAYRRFILEILSSLKDTVGEFEEYIVSSKEAIENNTEEESSDGDDEDGEFDDMDYLDDIKYNSEELITVENSIVLMNITIDSIKLALEIMSSSSDQIDIIKNSSTPASNISSVFTSPLLENKEIDTALAEIEVGNKCQVWVVIIQDYCRLLSDQILDFGAELYTPVDKNSVQAHGFELFEMLHSLEDLLINDSIISLLKPEDINLVENLKLKVKDFEPSFFIQHHGI